MGLKLAPLILFVPAAVKMTAAAESGGLSFPGVAIAAYVAGGKAPPGGIPYTVEDQSGDGQHRVVRFRKADGGDLIAELYLPPKQRGTVRLRAGSYQVNIAQGRRWHGPDVHFGRAGHVYDYGQHEIGGNVAGFNIGPASVTGTAHEIPDSRF
ncbi:MAG: hypothetical protein DI568_03060 [Sphingomonas sp.]|nr:MAG: hypothetical protein DI568_03060 [Sphingomonas sp.]